MQVSEISDGYLSPMDESESISSDIFGAPDLDEFQRSKRKFLMRLDEDREMRDHRALSPASSTRSCNSRPITRSVPRNNEIQSNLDFALNLEFTLN